MTLSVVHVVRQYSPSIGGLEAVVAQLASEQRRGLHHDVRVVTLDRVFHQSSERLPAREVIDGIVVDRLPWRGSTRYPLCPRVAAALAGADIVHVHAIDFFFDFLASTRWFHGRTLIASTHGGFFHTARFATLKRLWFNTITRLSATAYRCIVADSDSDAALFARIAPSRVKVIENGVELTRYHDAASREPGRVILYFGRWSVNKGLPRLFALLAALRRIDPGFRLIVAGRPYDLTEADLRRIAVEHDVVDAVEIHPSPTDAGIRRLMSQASYFGCLSTYEGFGVAAIEAMSAGLIPLLSDIPTFRKLVEASGIGLLIDDGDLDAAARAIVLAHEPDAAALAVLRTRAMAFVRRYEWSRVAMRFDEVYREARGDVRARPAEARP